jgi:cell division transport system permease protein
MSVVESVFYESQSEAFKRFQERFKDSAIAQNVTADQLPESFRVKLKDPTQFSVIVSAFSGRPGVDIVQDQRTILEKFFKLLGVLRNGALAVGLASVLTAALLISNTLRIAAFNRRRETGVMRLVGASHKYVKGPFVVNGILAGLVSSILVILIFSIGSFWISHSSSSIYFGGFSLFSYFIKNILLIIGTILGTGILLGVIASYLAVHKYLKN